ncbi:MAG: 2Fe-2S iron-sulfur cluster-binding protein [Planctomycetota bacterium]|nr:2Fe-2S iron-sulfur cluster-binding protein [Planctomycetota bacterium]
MAAHKVTFLPAGVTAAADPAKYPYGDHGLPGSILDVAQANKVHIEAACGGVGACGTCHVIIEAGPENLSDAGDDELDALDQVPGNTLSSRLACRAVVKGDVTVRVPAWNKNAVSEEH